MRWVERETVESTRSPSMARNVPQKIKTKGGHRPRARVHAGWSPIGQRLRRVALVRGLGVFLAVVLVVGFAADAYAQSFFDGLPSIQGLDSSGFAGDTSWPEEAPLRSSSPSSSSSHPTRPTPGRSRRSRSLMS